MTARFGNDGGCSANERRRDGRENVPGDRAGGRRGHPHAVVAAEGAAPDRRAIAAVACAGLRCARPAECASAVVVGPGHDAVAARSEGRSLPDAEIFVQTERRGTAHAVLAAKAAIARGADDVLVIFGDTPLIRPQTLAQACAAALADGAAVAVLGFRAGRSDRLRPAGDARATRSSPSASMPTPATAERAITLCNGGLMAFAGRQALEILEQIGNDNRKGEFYLTDAVAIARDMGRKAVALEVTEDEVSGINSKAQLAAAEGQIQQRLRQAALDAGVTLVAPETVFLAADTKLGRDVVVEPYVVFGPGVTVEEGATIRSFSHLARRACRQGRDRRSLRAAAARRQARREGSHRQLRRGQGGDDRGRRQGQPPQPTSATRGSARAPTSAPAPSPATTTAPPSTAPTSARAPSSARIRRWWRRSRSATAPISARARSSPATCRPTRWRSERGQQTVKEGWAKRLRSLKSAGKKAEQASG